jgi:hypothetical protein
MILDALPRRSPADRSAVWQSLSRFWTGRRIVAHRRIVALLLTLAALVVGPARAQYLDEYEFPATAVIRGENIWLRVEPAAETLIVSYLQRGDAVTLTGAAVTADDIDFVPVETASGETGWVRDLAIDPRSLGGPDEGAASDGGRGQTREPRRRQRDQPTAEAVPVPTIPEETPSPVEPSAEPTSTPVALEIAPGQDATPTAES